MQVVTDADAGAIGFSDARALLVQLKINEDEDLGAADANVNLYIQIKTIQYK